MSRIDLTMRYLTRCNNNDSNYNANIGLTSQLRRITMAFYDSIQPHDPTKEKNNEL